MVTVTVTKNASKQYIGIQSHGHAGFAQKGQDIVCAAVSVLVINTLNSIEVLTKDKDLMKITVNEEEGLIDCRFSSAVSKETILLLDAMVLGLEQIQEQYSKKYLKLIRKEQEV